MRCGECIIAPTKTLAARPRPQTISIARRGPSILMGARSAFALVALVATTTHALSDEALAKFQAATAANKIAEPFDPPHEAGEWYMVTIANVSRRLHAHATSRSTTNSCARWR